MVLVLSQFLFWKRSFGSIIVYPHTAAIPAGTTKPNPFLFLAATDKTNTLIATPLHQQA
jgi:hypothetical protein